LHPVLHKIHGYLLQIREELLPKSEAGQAANYILKNWIALTRYCEHADLSIDNFPHTQSRWVFGHPLAAGAAGLWACTIVNTLTIDSVQFRE
jgi:Transposase IS66 family